MGKLIVFNFITLNGFYKGIDNDIAWHRHGQEENEFAAGNMEGIAPTLIFGRKTYEMMAGYWPTPMAYNNNPDVARGMNRVNKIVFSRTLKKAEWNNTRLIKNDLVSEVKKLKKEAGKNFTVLGSGNLSDQLAEHGLVDEYQIMVDPVIIGNGESLFKSVTHTQNLKLINTRTFKSGVVLLCYEPVRD